MAQLRQSLGLTQATAMVVGTIIGASIFVQPSEITRLMPSVGGIVLVWLAAGVLTMCGALVCAELSSALPRTGGVYVFLTESFSPALGFLWGWAMFWSMHSGIIAAIAVVFARHVGIFVPLDPLGQKLVAVSVILVLSAVNYIGVKHGGRVQTIFTAAKVIAIVGTRPRSATSRSRWRQASSPMAAGTWSRTRRARRGRPRGRFPGPS
jgi:APA family basic amino acid/polyamine antiporter